MAISWDDFVRLMFFFLNSFFVKALAMSPVTTENKMQLGEALTRGLGAGGNPTIGQVGIY